MRAQRQAYSACDSKRCSSASSPTWCMHDSHFWSLMNLLQHSLPVLVTVANAGPAAHLLPPACLDGMHWCTPLPRPATGRLLLIATAAVQQPMLKLPVCCLATKVKGVPEQQPALTDAGRHQAK